MMLITYEGKERRAEVILYMSHRCANTSCDSSPRTSRTPRCGWRVMGRPSNGELSVWWRRQDEDKLSSRGRPIWRSAVSSICPWAALSYFFFLIVFLSLGRWVFILLVLLSPCLTVNSLPTLIWMVGEGEHLQLSPLKSSMPKINQELEWSGFAEGSDWAAGFPGAYALGKPSINIGGMTKSTGSLHLEGSPSPLFVLGVAGEVQRVTESGPGSTSGGLCM